jgi:hypothetical protein
MIPTATQAIVIKPSAMASIRGVVQSAPGVQCVGLTANLPLKGLPTELNALTKRASGNALRTLHEGLVEAGEELQHSVDGRIVGDRVGRIDGGLAGQVCGAGGT